MFVFHSGIRRSMLNWQAAAIRIMAFKAEFKPPQPCVTFDERHLRSQNPKRRDFPTSQSFQSRDKERLPSWTHTSPSLNKVASKGNEFPGGGFRTKTIIVLQSPGIPPRTTVHPAILPPPPLSSLFLILPGGGAKNTFEFNARRVPDPDSENAFHKV